MYGPLLGTHAIRIQTHPLPGSRLRRGMPTGIVTPQPCQSRAKSPLGLAKPGAYSKQIETPFRDLWVHKYQYLHKKLQNFTDFPHFPMHVSTYTLVLGCNLQTPNSRPFLIRFRWDLDLWKGIEALYLAPQLCKSMTYMVRPPQRRG